PSRSLSTRTAWPCTYWPRPGRRSRRRPACRQKPQAPPVPPARTPPAACHPSQSLHTVEKCDGNGCESPRISYENANGQPQKSAKGGRIYGALSKLVAGPAALRISWCGTRRRGRPTPPAPPRGRSVLRILGSPKRLCEGWTRREMLRAGGLG